MGEGTENEKKNQPPNSHELAVFQSEISSFIQTENKTD